MTRRIAITGLGVVTGLGVGMGPTWEGLVGGRSALRRMTRLDPSGFHSRLAGEVSELSGKDFVPKSYRKATKVMARDMELAVAAAKLAVEDARLSTRGTQDGAPSPPTYPSARMGCHVGAGMIACEVDELSAALVTSLDERGVVDLRAWGPEDGGRGAMNNLQPLWLLKYLPNMLACHVTIVHGAEGPSNTITCCEASGLLSLGESVRVIQRGDADLCYTGGADSRITPMGIVRMELAGRLAATGDEADGARVVRPYDPRSAGGLLGEAGGILIVEAMETARARGAPLYAEVAGFGAGQSASMYYSAPDEAGPLPGDGLVAAVEAAIKSAGITPEQIDAIIPHASGIPAMDAGEAEGLREVFGARLGRIPLVTLTPAIGDCMAGNGGVAAAVAAMCLREQKLPARIHAGTPAAGLDAGAAPARDAKLDYVLVATNAMGGQNAAAVLRALR